MTKVLVEFGSSKNEETAKAFAQQKRKELGRSAHVRVLKKNLRAEGFNLPVWYVLVWRDEA